MHSLRLRNCTNAVVTVLGMTFKEDVPDIRNSKVIDIVRELERFGVRVQVHDPLADAGDRQRGICGLADAARGAATGRRRHSGGRASGLCERRLAAGDPATERRHGTVLDVKSRLDRAQKPEGIELWRL